MSKFEYEYEVTREGNITIFNDYSFINKGENFNYNNLTEALKDWLPVLLASNEYHYKENGCDYFIWSKEKIEFIKNL